LNCIGIDDAPFPRGHRGDVSVFGCVFSRHRLDGLITTRVRRDGANATRRIAQMIAASPFREHIRAVLMKGIAVGGFNVVDIHALHEALGIPILIVNRRSPNLPLIRTTLLDHIAGGKEKWALIEKAGAMERAGQLYIQRAGLDLARARDIVRDTVWHGNIPEPLRVAHIIAGGVTTGTSHGRA
jgi:endonuclease V-like protein UPF0215 family